MASKKLTSDEVNALMEGLQNSDYSVALIWQNQMMCAPLLSARMTSA